jgi:hypothetical protein
VVVEQLDRLNRTRNRLAQPDGGSPLFALTKKVAESVRSDFREILSYRQREKRYEAADRLCQSNGADLDKLMSALSQEYEQVLSENSKEVALLLKEKDFADFRNAYQTYHWDDMLTLPFLDGTDAKEHTIIEVYRVGPADGTLTPKPIDGRPAAGKLAGTAAGDFGGFLQGSWRENDMMWGRLDGAERIITALLPDPGDAAVRQNLINCAQDAILREELSPPHQGVIFRWVAETLRRQMGADFTVDDLIPHAEKLYKNIAPAIDVGDFRLFIKEQYRTPDPPGAEQIVEWTSRALRIFSGMLAELDDKSTGVAPWLSRVIRWAGLMIGQLATFAVPRRPGWWLLRRWLALVALAALLLVLAGIVFKVGRVSSVGYGTLAACLAVFVLQTTFGDVVRRRPRASWWLINLGRLVALLLILDGFRDVLIRILRILPQYFDTPPFGPMH